MKRFLFGAFALSFVAAAPAMAVELIKNGDFENNGGVGQIAPTTPSRTTLADWTKTVVKDPGSQGFAFVVDANADSTGFPSIFSGTPPTNMIKIWGPANGVANGFTGSKNGGKFLGIDGDYGRSSVEQSISGLTINDTYTLKFEYAGGQFTDEQGPTDQYWVVDFGSQTTQTPIMKVPSKGFVGWNDFSYDFVASSITQTLKFTAIGYASGAPGSLPPFLMMDGVSLQRSGSTPVPGPLPVLGGAAALGWSRKLRKRIKVAGLHKA